MLFVFVMLVAYACNQKKSDNVDTLSAPEEAVVIPDSGWYYDSINAPVKARVHQYFLDKHSSGHFNGCYLIADHGYIVDTGYYGYANYRTEDTLNLNAAFQLASVSKPFTAMAILRLVEAGKLALDAPVKQYLPDLPYDGITLKMLLCHRGGLGNYTYFTEYLMKDSTGILYNESIMAILQDTVPEVYFLPDTRFDYSNTGYALLALIVQRVTKQPFNKWMAQNFFAQFNMKDAFVHSGTRDELPEGTAVGHLWDHRAPGNDYLNGVVGDKGMYASVMDLYQFDKALYRGDVLSDSLQQICFSAHNPVKHDSSSYGLGWRLINPNSPKKIVYHTGWWQGSRSYFIRYPGLQKTIIVLDNVKRGPWLGVKELLSLIEPNV